MDVAVGEHGKDMDADDARPQTTEPAASAQATIPLALAANQNT
jgi:hypothetical protein